MKRFVVFLFGVFLSAISYADTCTQSQIDLGNGECVDTKFSLTTSSTDSFNFRMSASGTFYIDCGNGGTLTSTADDVSDKTVVRSNTDGATYTCTWQSADIQTIRFAGAATGYNTANNVATISFNISATAEKLVAISGSLGAIFGTLGQANGQQPRFIKTFEYSQITTIPPELFSGITGGTEHMFNSTFKDCKKLTTIPSGLFQNITSAPSLFSGTFYNSGIFSIPEDLFSNIKSASPGLFSTTFFACSALQSIPENLFANVSGAANNMFYATFGACHRLTTIPEKLFIGINGCDTYLFYRTFSGCNRLASLPENLFSGISCSASNMFKETFQNSGVLSGYIPPSAFRGLITNNSPTATDMWLDAFSGTQLDTTCPAGTTEFDTGYKTAWGGKVSCVEDAPHVCSAGEYLPKMYNSCTVCPAGKYCTGGTFNFSASTTQGLSGNITAGYFGNGGTTTATPTSEDCLSGYTCGTCRGQSGTNGRPLYTDAGGGASACSECPAVSDELASRATGYYGYYPSTRDRGISGCLARFFDSDDAATFTTICYRGGGTYGDSTSQCQTASPTACAAGKYNTITQTPEWRYAGNEAATCNGVDCMKGRVCTDADAGYYSPEGATTQTICPAGTFSPTGSAVCYPHILHVGNDVVYLKSTKQTTPSLNFRIGNDMFYANMTTVRTKMNKDSDHYFHAQWENNDYYICDDTTCKQ